MNSKLLTKNSIIASIYILLTIINPISYGFIQMRISEMLLIYPFYDKKTKIGCIIGVLLANMFSPLGFIDVIFGGATALILYYIIDKLKCNNIIKCVLYSIECGMIIGLEMVIVYKMPYLISIGSIFLSQIIITLIALPIINLIFEKISKFK